MGEPIFMKFGMYIMAPEPISTAYFINPSHQSACLYVYLLLFVWQRLGKNPPIVARQWLRKNITPVMNTQPTKEELSDASFSMRSVSYQGKQAISSSQNFLYNNRVSDIAPFNIKPEIYDSLKDTDFLLRQLQRGNDERID
jgi:hypothetical protein